MAHEQITPKNYANSSRDE